MKLTTTDIMNELKKAYDNLPKGYKKLAADYYGCSEIWFKKLIDENPSDIGTQANMLAAIKLAGTQAMEDAKQAYETIKDIAVVYHDLNPKK